MRRLAWAAAVAVVLIGAALAVGSAYSLVAPANAADQRTRLVQIPEGASTATIGELLAGEGIVKNGLAFRLAARLSHQDVGLQAGWYELSPSMTTDAILKKLAAGDVAHFRVTIPEGLTVPEIVSRLVAAHVGDEAALERAVSDRGLVAEWLPADAQVKEPLEGYLFPDTYTFPYGVTADEAVAAMVDRFRSVWTDERLARAEALGLTVNAATTLASIIELETKFPEDRPLVSAVFHNRLKRGMALRSDVTTAYAVGKPASQLTREDFQDPSPYNTYVAPGLPPGPICSPSLASLEAALAPADVDYLYFVAQPDGHLLYATTYSQHLRNVAKVRSMGGK